MKSTSGKPFTVYFDKLLNTKSCCERVKQDKIPWRATFAELARKSVQDQLPFCVGEKQICQHVDKCY